MPERRVPASLRRTVEDRAQGCCEYCRSQARVSVQSYSIEHVVPRSRGGQADLDNLAFACQGCNNAKYAKTEARDPVTGDAVPLFHPRLDAWSDHFAWSDDYSLVLGISPIGRATVGALQLNRPGGVMLQRLLYSAGEHPPE